MNHNKKIKVGWVLLGDKNVGSTRIHGINIHNFLNANGIKSEIIQTSSISNISLDLSLIQCMKVLFSGYNVIFFQKVYAGKSVFFAKLCKVFGIKTVYIQADLIENPMIKVVDKVVVVSDFLKKHYCDSYGINAVFIDDAIENVSLNYKKHISNEKLKLVWVGHSDNWKTLSIVMDAIETIGDNSIELTTISNHPDAMYKWDVDTVSKLIMENDVGVIPSFELDWNKAKSSNRLTLFASLGIPIIASPVPSYLDILTDNEEVFFVKDRDDWCKAILKLKDPVVRQKISDKALEKVLSSYSINAIGAKWFNLINDII